jgi:hypothetical protein
VAIVVFQRNHLRLEIITIPSKFWPVMASYIYIYTVYIYIYMYRYILYIYICHGKPVKPVTVTVVGLLLNQVLPSLKAAKASAALTICTSSSDLAPTAIPSPI